VSGVTVVQAGNYDLQIDTGFSQNGFTLDDPVKGVLDNTTYVLDGSNDYASVLDGATTVSVRRGRRNIGDTFSAGTMSFTLNDTASGGVFNPFNTDSPYYDPANQQPGLAPLRAVRLLRYDVDSNIEYLFKGYIVNYEYNFNLGELDTVEVYCADDFYLLSQTSLNEYNVGADTSGERITAVLDLPEIGFPAAARNIATGTVNLGYAAPYIVPGGTNALQYLTQIAYEAEQGRLFMSRDGVLTFQTRIGATLSTAAAEFNDDGTNIKYNGVGISFEADQVINRVVVRTLGDNSATAEDTASQATYFIQTTDINNSLLDTDAAALTLAEYLLVGEPIARYTDLTTNFASLSIGQRDTVAVVDIGDTITIQKTFTAGTSTTSLAQQLSVEGIEHRINVANGHTVSYYTSPTTILYYLILDDPVYGVLDSNNVLG